MTRPRPTHRSQTEAELGLIGSDFDAISLDVDLSTGSVTGRLGNKTVTAMLSPVEGRGLDLRLGASYANNDRGAFRINIDDVTLDQ